MGLFDKNWFKKRQKILIWLFNAPVVKHLTWKFFDLKNNGIEEIRPVQEVGVNYLKYEYDAYNNKDAFSFFKYPFFTKEIFHNLYWVWWLAHQWDMLTRFAPALNLGFDDFSPNAHPELSSVDGFAYDETTGNFATLRGATGTAAVDSGATPNFAYLRATTNSNEYNRMDRGIWLFDTSALSDSAVIESAIFKLFGLGTTTTLDSGGALGVVASSPASNTAIVAGDYDSLGTTRFCDTDIASASFSTSSYNQWNFNASGKAAISKTGVTKLGTKFAWDIDNSAPTWSSAGEALFYGRGADDGVNVPILTVIVEGSGVRRRDLTLLGVG